MAIGGAAIGGFPISGFPVRRVAGSGPTSVIPVAWLEGDGTYWQDSARTTAANADTNPVGAWDDASGAGKHATQATAGSRPTLQTAEVNGVSAVQFDGTDDILSSPAEVASGTPVTVIAVLRLLADGNFTYPIGDASSFRGIRITSGRTVSLCDNDQDIASPDAIGSSWVIVTGILDGTNGTLRVNGVQKATAASTQTGWIGGLTVGGRGTGASWQNCQVAEVLLYDSALTGTDLTDVEAYLTTKYFAGGSGTTVTPGTASLSLTTFAPTVIAPRTVTPSTASLTLSTFAPTVATPRLVAPGVASLSISTFAPTITTPRTVTPGTASLTLTTFAPSVTASSGLTLVPGTASLTLATFAPTVSNPRVVTPGTASLSISSFAPGVVVGIVSTPDPAALTLSTFAPVVQTPRVVTPGVLSLTLATFAPNVAIAGAATIPVAARWIATGTVRQWVADGKVRRWVAGRNQMVKNTITKTPGDALIRLEMDFSDLPELDSATIASVTSVVASPVGLTIGSEQVEVGDKAASAVFSGGTNGTDYEVTFTVLLSSGETLARTGLLRVRTR